MYDKEISDAKRVVAEFLNEIQLKRGSLVVIGCSTSEIAAHGIGSYSNAELGEAVFVAMYEKLVKAKLAVAAQCCEHLNRVLIMTEEDAERFGYEIVNVIPQPKAGGSFSTAAWKHMKNPVAVEHVQAHAGIDVEDPRRITDFRHQFPYGRAGAFCAHQINMGSAA